MIWISNMIRKKAGSKIHFIFFFCNLNSQLRNKSVSLMNSTGQDFRTAPYFIMHTALCLKKTIARISNAHF